MLREIWDDAVGLSLSFVIWRPSDDTFYDTSDQTFKATPTSPRTAMTVLDDTLYPDKYVIHIASTPQEEFTNGDYRILVVSSDDPYTPRTGIIAISCYNGNFNSIWFTVGGRLILKTPA
jgi:hypothetical protein